MSERWSWGVDPGTANMGAVLCDGAQPIIIIDVVSRPATKGRKATKRKPAEPGLPKRLEATLFAQRTGSGAALVGETFVLEADDYDALDAFKRALDAVCWPGEPSVAVERVMGQLGDLADVAGAIVGILWQRCGGQRPKRPSAATWRRRMLDIPGNTPAAVAERLALERVREEVPDWPSTASGHAAEAYWIARWGAEVSGGR